MENIEQFAAKAQTQYQIRPPFKAKFRPAEARAAIEKLIPELVRTHKQRDTRQQAIQDDDSDEEESGSGDGENEQDGANARQ